MWFRDLTGFEEFAVDNVADHVSVDGRFLVSNVNGRRMRYGEFDTPRLSELRSQTKRPVLPRSPLQLRELLADVQALHLDPTNRGAFFQVASQFNTLEMVSPAVTPEDGVDRYEADHTQGPACAIACGAGTLFRNYFVPVDGQRGQTADLQINCVADLLNTLEVNFEATNGYVFVSEPELMAVGALLRTLSEPERDAYMGALSIGVQTATEVTLTGADHNVTQAYCSAFPVAYSNASAEAWEPLARLVLDASYEATFRAALLNAEASGTTSVYLTMIGGGVFGNRSEWIVDAIRRSATIFRHSGLDVSLVSHNRANPVLQSLFDPKPTWADVLFSSPPNQWGLRGDPTLWAELHEALRRLPKPASDAALLAVIRREFHRLTGAHLDDFAGGPAVHMERYYSGGTSAGRIAPQVWQETLIPLILNRFNTSGSVG